MEIKLEITSQALTPKQKGAIVERLQEIRAIVKGVSPQPNTENKYKAVSERAIKKWLDKEQKKFRIRPLASLKYSPSSPQEREVLIADFDDNQKENEKIPLDGSAYQTTPPISGKKIEVCRIGNLLFVEHYRLR